MRCFKCLSALGESGGIYGLHERCFKEWFQLSSVVEFRSLVRRLPALDSASYLNSSQNDSFFQGQFRKYSAELAGESYIMKMREQEAPELPEVEYLCNQIGECVGIPVALFYYIEFLDERVFITKNFIKREQPANLQHIYHYRSHDRHDCETLIEVIKKTTGRVSDIIVFIGALLFDSLIGNHDRHGRNLAFIISSEGTRLSPIYDNVSYLGLESGSMLKADFNPLGKVATRENLNPSMSDYVLQFCQLGYETHVRKFARKLDIDKVRLLIDASFCSELMKDAFHRLVNKRRKELIDALGKK